jgi:hypothetical protein
MLTLYSVAFCAVIAVNAVGIGAIIVAARRDLARALEP